MRRLIQQNTVGYLGSFAVLAVAYYVAGHLTLLLATPPSHATPVWPGAGIALAAVLIKGYRILPAVFISEFIIAGEIFGFDSPMSQALNAALGLQALLHAWIGAYLIRHTVGADNPLHDDASIIEFMLLGGPISAVFPALLSLMALGFAGIVGEADFAMGFFTWWLGNTIGVIIFSPLTLILFGEPRSAWRRRRFSVALPLTGIFILIVLFFGYAQQKEKERLALIFEEQVSTLQNAIVQALTAQFEILYDLRSYFEGSKRVRQDEFNAFTRFTLQRHKGIHALQWIPRVPGEARALFEAEHGVTITERRAPGTVVPANVRGEYFPILYAEPAARNRRAIGFDTASDPVARPAQIRALSTGELSATAPFQPAHRPPTGTSVVIYQSVPARDGTGRQPIRGLIAGVFGIDDLIGDAVQEEPHRHSVELSLTDESEPDSPVLLFGRHVGPAAAAPAPHGHRRKIALAMAGRTWALEFAATPEFVTGNSSWTHWWIFSAGFLFTGLFGIALLSMTGHRANLESEIDERTDALRNSERKYRELVENANSIILRFDPTGRILFFNRYAQNYFGYNEEEIIGRSILDTIVPEVASEGGPPLKAMIRDIGKNPERCLNNEDENVRRDGSRVWINWANHATYDAEGNLSEILSIGIDVTEKKHAAQNLRKLSLAVEHSPSAVFITDVSGHIEYVNPKFTEITGYASEEVIGRTPRMLKSDEVLEEQYQELWGTLLSGKEWRGVLRNRRKSGEHYWAQEFIAPIKNDSGHITHFVAIQEDVTEARRISDQISFQASHDVLTGLTNRREFEQCLKRVIGTARETHSEHALCFLDLDHFKIVNDTCGHVAGDELLRQVGLLLREDLRKRDVLARLGGDEFAILMEYCSVSHARRVATKIRDRVEQFRFFWGDRSFHIGVSIGITAIDCDSPDVADLMSQADNACYAAKDAGRSRVHVFRKEDQDLTQRVGEIRWVTEIDQAIKHDRLYLLAQPVISLAADGRIALYEIFLRMEDSSGSVVQPSAFLSAAERYNLIHTIDRWVIEKTIDWIASNPRPPSEPIGFSINLSGYSLNDEGLTAFIVERLRIASVAANSVVFEIAETAAINNLSDAALFIKSLKAAGCRFALDDFGSGLSSFAYLKNLPVDFLKIDGHFFRDIEKDPVNFAMVKSINDIGHLMGMRTIAECVETHALMSTLRTLGIDFTQGYASGPPVPLASLGSLRILRP